MEQKKQSISVKLNGKEQSIRESTEVAATTEQQNENQVHHLPPQNVIDFNEKHDIRKRNGQPYWDDGNREKSPKIPFKRKKKPQSSPKRPFPFMLVAALLSAVIVGISLGLVMLNVFTNNEQVEGNETTTGAVPSFSENAVGLPTLTLEVVQGAAFTEREQGLGTVAKLHEKNLAAVLTEETDPIYMFIGVAGDRAQATKLSGLYEGYGQETYLKSYRVDGQAVQDQGEEVKQWFTEAISIYQETVQLSIDGLNGGVMITEDRMNQLEEKLNSLQESRNQAFSQLPKEAQTHALAIGDKLVLAKDGLKEALSSSEEKDLWSAQQSLLEVLVQYELLIKSL